MIPENRLAVLLEQVKSGWISRCLFHSTVEAPSLFTDHICDENDFPQRTILELLPHADEVWYLAFSNDGSMLATASKDNTVVIYETEAYKIVHTLSDHGSGVCYVAWSPDDSKLVTCAQARDNSARVWDLIVSFFRATLNIWTNSCSLGRVC
jgi:WD repeat-containing protein 26